MLAAIFLNGVWFLLWQTFTTGFPGHCGTAALGNAHAMCLCSIPSLPLVMFGLYECRVSGTTLSVPRFVLRLPFVLLFTFIIARFPICIALACQGHPSSDWPGLALSAAGRLFTLGCA